MASPTNDDASGQGATEQAKQTAQEAASTVRDRLREQVDQRSTQAGEQVGTVAGDLRQVSEQLREQGKDGPAKIGEQAADRVESVSGYLSESDADKLIRDVEDLGRRQPLLAVAGGVVLGLAAARFLKASAQERYESGRSNGGGTGAPERQPMPPTVGNLTETTPVSYGDTATAEAAAAEIPAAGTPAAAPVR
jgi:hypothetical protein